MRLVVDIETNAIENPSIIWCVVAKDIDTGRVYEYEQGNYEGLRLLLRQADLVIGHNIIQFDYPNVSRILGNDFLDPSKIRDTLVLAHLFNFNLEGGHSLEQWGTRLGTRKVGTDIKRWDIYDPLMLERCRSDVEINAKLYLWLENKLHPKYFKEAIDAEHKIAFISLGMRLDGFAFDRDGCVKLLLETRERLAELDRELENAFPPKIKVTQLKTKTKTEEVPFNAGSVKQLVERLNECGWKPVEKTATGKSWKVSEVNLATLPDTAPRAAHRLVERILLRTRVSTLESWLAFYNDKTGSVHGTFRGVGTWTHRMGHRNPNLGNISAQKSIKYKGKYLNDLATDYGGRMRSLWGQCGDDSWLVGTDAESIQLRIFAHYINDDEFTKALLSGSKEQGTDPHSLNGRILGCSRDSAKTFIYAFLLGAGDRKIAEILGVDTRAGKAARQRFINAYPGLQKLKEQDIPRDARRGYFEAFDGRLVVVPGDEDERNHLTLAGYLQNGEACIMKHACIKWRQDARRDGIRFRQVNFVHDEWQTLSLNRDHAYAQQLGSIQAASITSIGEQFKLRCPMAGAYRIGKNWLETH